MPDFTRPAPTFETITETVYVLLDDRVSDWTITGGAATIEGSINLAKEQPLSPMIDGVRPVEVKIQRQSLRPIYGGGTLIENLWAEMDAIMERLMTGQQAEDGGDRFRAEELAWVLAIVTNAYDPSVDRIRAETMERWNAAQREADLQEEALDPDQPDPDEQQHQFDAAGVNGYEL